MVRRIGSGESLQPSAPPCRDLPSRARGWSAWRRPPLRLVPCQGLQKALSADLPGGSAGPWPLQLAGGSARAGHCQLLAMAGERAGGSTSGREAVGAKWQRAGSPTWSRSGFGFASGPSHGPRSRAYRCWGTEAPAAGVKCSGWPPTTGPAGPAGRPSWRGRVQRPYGRQRGAGSLLGHGPSRTAPSLPSRSVSPAAAVAQRWPWTHSFLATGAPPRVTGIASSGHAARGSDTGQESVQALLDQLENTKWRPLQRERPMPLGCA